MTVFTFNFFLISVLWLCGHGCIWLWCIPEVQCCPIWCSSSRWACSHQIFKYSYLTSILKLSCFLHNSSVMTLFLIAWIGGLIQIMWIMRTLLEHTQVVPGNLGKGWGSDFIIVKRCTNFFMFENHVICFIIILYLRSNELSLMRF